MKKYLAILAALPLAGCAVGGDNTAGRHEPPNLTHYAPTLADDANSLVATSWEALENNEVTPVEPGTTLSDYTDQTGANGVIDKIVVGVIELPTTNPAISQNPDSFTNTSDIPILTHVGDIRPELDRAAYTRTLSGGELLPAEVYLRNIKTGTTYHSDSPGLSLINSEDNITVEDGTPGASGPLDRMTLGTTTLVSIFNVATQPNPDDKFVAPTILIGELTSPTHTVLYDPGGTIYYLDNETRELVGLFTGIPYFTNGDSFTDISTREPADGELMAELSESAQLGVFISFDTHHQD